jgi:hypothetical protein
MVIVQNLKTMAVSRYEGVDAGGATPWDFNAFAEAGGDVYASGPDGIFLLDGPDDDGADIRMNVVCGPSDLGADRIKRVSDAYVRLKGGATPASVVGAAPGVNGSGGFTLSVTTDDNVAVDYVVEDTDEVLHTKKINLAKGAKGVFWTFAISSEAGMIEIESVRLNVDVLSRRVLTR